MPSFSRCPDEPFPGAKRPRSDLQFEIVAGNMAEETGISALHCPQHIAPIALLPPRAYPQQGGNEPGRAQYSGRPASNHTLRTTLTAKAYPHSSGVFLAILTLYLRYMHLCYPQPTL
jgi:hypothetical protein